MTNDTTPIQHDSPAVIAYVQLLQGNITRMAANSSACRNWCILLVAAILAATASSGQAGLAAIGIVPIVVFLYLDTLYLSIERGYRDRFNSFVEKVHRESVTIGDLFIMVPGGVHFPRPVLSPVILCFYCGLAFTLLLARTLLLMDGPGAATAIPPNP